MDNACISYGSMSVIHRGVVVPSKYGLSPEAEAAHNTVCVHTNYTMLPLLQACNTQSTDHHHNAQAKPMKGPLNYRGVSKQGKMDKLCCMLDAVGIE